MSRRVLVTGSTDGIGRQTARDLVRAGHQVVLHSRSEERAEVARAEVPGAAAVLVGDLASLEQTVAVGEAAAAHVEAHGPFDAVVHNAGVGGGAPHRQITGDGLSSIFQVNVLAPYVLTALVPPPARLVYLTSGLQAQGRVDLEDLQHELGPWDGMQAYSDSKLCDVLLAFAVARRWPASRSNAVDPGWIKTRMGGPSATDELPEGAATQVWLATSEDPGATVTGRYLKRKQELEPNPQARDEDLQEGLLAACARLSGVQLPS